MDAVIANFEFVQQTNPSLRIRQAMLLCMNLQQYYELITQVFRGGEFNFLR